MNPEHIIDLDRQFLDLFNKEKMLACFDFQLPIGSNQTVSGICKISRPKEGSAKSTYFSLLFIIDAPDDEVWRDIDAFVSGINWEDLKNELPGVEAVLSLQYLTRGPGICFKETDIYVSSNVELTELYVSRKLCPAVSRVTGLKMGELMLWDLAVEPKAARIEKAQDETWAEPLSFVERLRKFLGSS